MDKMNFYREEAMEKILEVYSRWYNLQAELPKAATGTEADGTALTLVHSGRLDEAQGEYVMSRRAMIWEAESHEYVYFFHATHLRKADVEKALAESYIRGMECIVPGPKHRCSCISTVLVADAADDEAIAYIKKYQKRENFRLSLHGWMDQMVALVIPERIEVSPGGKRIEDILEYALDPEGYRESRRGLKGFFKKLFR